MSSISKAELLVAIEDMPDDAEVIMNIRHNYPISEESGKRGWLAYINGIHCDKEFNEIRLMN